MSLEPTYLPQSAWYELKNALHEKLFFLLV